MGIINACINVEYTMNRPTENGVIASRRVLDTRAVSIGGVS